MSRVFVDTSAILALLVPSDTAHQRARWVFAQLEARQAVLVTTSYVLLETYALLSRRLGLAAVVAFRNDWVPLMEVLWVGAALHERGLDLMIERGSSRLSLVDAVSFLTVRDLRIPEVFAYDSHFEGEGFALLGSGK